MRKQSNSLGGNNTKVLTKKLHLWIFPVIMAVSYGAFFSLSPDRTFVALKASINIFLQITLPLVIAFTMMFIINFFIEPMQIAQFMGKNAGVKGIFISSMAGVLSMGPIYAWYPFLKSIREKGASDFYLANFLSSRAVKPFLFPVMIFYFGWVFTVTLNVLILTGAIIVAFVTNIASQDRKKRDSV